MLLFLKANDTGYTYASGVSISRKFNHGTATLEGRSSLFTKPMIENDASVFNRLSAMLNTGQVTDFSVLQQPGVIHQNFIDSELIRLSYQSDGPIFFDTSIGYDRRTTTEEHGRPLADATQYWWHHKLLNIYYFDGGLVSTPGSIVTKGTTAYLTPGMDADPRFKEVAPNSYLASAAIGINRSLLNATCKLKAKIGFSLATEGKQIVGPNSTVNADAELNATIFKTKTGQPRIKAGIGGAIFYYPTAFSGDTGTKFGTQISTEIESIHRVGKKGDSITAFMDFYMPEGHQQFFFSNPDQGTAGVINKFGFRVNF